MSADHISRGAHPIVLVVQWLSTFELIAPVHRALCERGVPVLVAVTPESHRHTGEADLATAQRVWDQLSADGFDPLPLVLMEEEAARLRLLEPTAVFLSTPYDRQRHPSLAPGRLGLPVHYVNYYFRVTPNGSFGDLVTYDFFDHCATIYCETEYERDLFVESGMDPARLLLTGHPGLDVWDAPHPLARRPTVLWCPWWGHVGLDGEVGYSTFLPSWEPVLAEAACRPGIDFLFRPHPFMFDQLEDLWGPGEEERFRTAMAGLANVVEFEADVTSHVEQLGSAWAMVTDGVSFFPEFAYTGKPLLLTQAPGNPGWNPVGRAIEGVVRTSLVADGQVPGLAEFLDEVERGVDAEEVERRQRAVREILRRPEGGAAPRIADHLAERRQERLARSKPDAPSAPVVLVAQVLPTFELMLPVVAELRERAIPVEVVVTATPDGQGGYLLAEAEDFHARLVDDGLAPLPLVPPEEEAARLRSLDPCAVFLDTPYAFQRHPDLAPERLGLPVHYLTYFFRVRPEVFGGVVSDGFYDQLAAIYCETEYERDLFLESGMDPARLLLTGHPGLDVWDAPHPLASRPTVLWCPWWGHGAGDGTVGYSTFLPSWEPVLAEAARRPGTDFLFRPHPMLWEEVEEFWGPGEEERFRTALAGLANVVEFEAELTSHVEQLGSAWAMVTDGVSFFPEFAYTGKPLLLTQAPGNPGWNPVGRAIEGVVRTSLVADGQVPGLAEFLDEVERGVDAEEVERRQRAVREILGRPKGGAAPRIADHLEQVRASHRARPSRARRSAPPRLPDDVLAAVEALNEWDAPRVGRTYQRMLLESGRLAWIDGSVVAQTFPQQSGHAGSPTVLADGTVLLPGALHEGWPIDRVLIGGTVYSTLGEGAGAPLGAAADVLGAGHAHRLSEAVPADGPRTLWIGVRGVWHDLWNQLPALVHWEPLLADLIAAGELVARVDDGARAQLESLAPLHRLLPLLAPSIPGSARGVPPVGSVRCSSTWVSDAAASRVRSWLSSEPVPTRLLHGSPRLWIVVDDDNEAPRDVVDIAAQIAVLWHRSTGGDTVIHTWSPDPAERVQSWMRPRIDAANRLGAAALARAASLGAPTGSVLTTAGLDLGAALAWMGSADFHVSCGGDSARGPVWLAGLRGVLLLGRREHRQSVSDWYRDQAEQPPTLEPSPAAMVVDADGGWRSSDPAELAAWALSRYRAVT